MKKRLAAILAIAGLSLAGLVVNTPAANAAEQCTVKGFSPRSVTVGLSPKKVRFDVQASGCDLTDWELLSSDYSVWVWKDSPYETLNPWYLHNSSAGHNDMLVTAMNSDWEDTERIFRGGFDLKRYAYWQSKSFNASPEPVKKNKTITIKGRLKVADWDNDRYVGYKNRTVKIQFRAKGSSSWTTVKTTQTHSDGWFKTTTKAKKSGTWRALYGGSTASGAATSPADYVEVK